MNIPQTGFTPGRAYVGWVDTAKGLGIILVVLGHVLRGVVASDLLTPTPAVEFVDAWIYAFHMPLFFFVSGLFLFRSAEKPARDFAWNKIGTIAYPYVVWSLITLMIKSALGQIVNQPRTLSEIGEILCCPIEQFWFLYVLFLLSIAIGFLLKFGMKPWAIIFLAAFLYPGIWPLPWSGWMPFEMARSYGIYMALGIAVGSSPLFVWLSSAGERPLAAVSIVGFFMVTSLAAFLESSHAHSLDFISAASGTAAVVALAVLVNRAKMDSAIRFLGRYSLEIYVAHTMASAAIRIIFQQVWHLTVPAIYILVGTAVGLYGPAFAAIALERIGFRWAFTLSERNKLGSLQQKSLG